jgi:hypothetical protein
MTAKKSYEELKQHLDASYANRKQPLEERRRALDEEDNALEEWYKTRLTFLDEVWSDPNSDRAPLPSEERRDTATLPRESHLERNGSGSYRPSTEPSNHRPWGGRTRAQAVREVLGEIQDEIITQPLVRQRFVEKHPGSDSASLQTAISHLLKQLADEGELVRIGKGTATEPYKYRRKTKQQEEVKPVGP